MSFDLIEAAQTPWGSFHTFNDPTHRRFPMLPFKERASPLEVATTSREYGRASDKRSELARLSTFLRKNMTLVG
jgi:hypothetical protein